MKAGPMAACMKTNMPFYSVATPERKAIRNRIVTAYPPSTRHDYEAAMGALWCGAYSEEKYVAVGCARSFVVT